jgi:hypothetical protein
LVIGASTLSSWSLKFWEFSKITCKGTMVQCSLWLYENHGCDWKSVLWSFSNLWSRVHLPNPSQLRWFFFLMKKREPVNTGSKFKPLSFFFIHCFKGAGFDPIFLAQIMSNLSHKDQGRLFLVYSNTLWHVAKFHSILVWAVWFLYNLPTLFKGVKNIHKPGFWFFSLHSHGFDAR